MPKRRASNSKTKKRRQTPKRVTLMHFCAPSQPGRPPRSRTARLIAPRAAKRLPHVRTAPRLDILAFLLHEVGLPRASSLHTNLHSSLGRRKDSLLATRTPPSGRNSPSEGQSWRAPMRAKKQAKREPTAVDPIQLLRHRRAFAKDRSVSAEKLMSSYGLKVNGRFS